MSNSIHTKPKIQLTPEAVAGSLLIPQPAQTSMDIGRREDILPGLFINVSVAEIDFFDKNPRTRHDPELYRQIKESIRESGVQQPVHITRRPGSSRFLLSQGGNTRLKIMQELLAETGDTRFAEIPAIYTEYTSEADIQIAHLIENEQRAEMCFWDKAQAYAAIREMFQSQSEKKLSLRELETLFLTHGLSMSHAQLGLMFFAADNLHPLGGLSLYLSNPKCLDIRKLFNQLDTELKAVGAETRLPDFWRSSLSAWSEAHPDDSELNVPALGKFLQQRFTETFGDILPKQEAHNSAESTATASVSGQGTATADRQPENLPDTSKPGQMQPERQEAATAIQPDNGSQLPATTDHGHADTTVAAAVDPLPQQHITQETAPADLPIALSRDEAVRRLHTAVRAMLQQVHLAHCFRSHPAFRYGFYLEYPDFHHIRPTNPPALYVVDNLHEDAGDVFAYLSRVSMQEALLNNPDLGGSNPLLQLPTDSPLRLAYQDPDTLDEYNTMGIGERHYLLDQVLRWQTTDTPYTQLVEDILAMLRHIHRSEEDNRG
ncbi:ParB N-terminal domain-containing protein [Neisseria sicca]|uniref:ParB N-terminal domain-containing protein n=1 Tax=Neisseria sicca TaxID=490 RepID=UPI000D31B43A|nr:ParB N-terminal domain-containing protein [Neisseria sicca]